MRVIIAGSRDITDYEIVKQAINASGFEITCVVSGGARGVDMLAIQYAREYGIKWKFFPADWDTYGKAAGPMRNSQMAENADALIAVWDGKSRGTADMIRKAQAKGLKVSIYKVGE